MTGQRAGLSTHVLDTALGRPGRNIKLRLYRVGDQRELLMERRTNDDGRTDQPLLQGGAESGTELASTNTAEFEQGTYELVFDVAEYFAQYHPAAPTPPFFDEVTLRFTLSDETHYHVPLLLSPWSYSTYRGS